MKRLGRLSQAVLAVGILFPSLGADAPPAADPLEPARDRIRIHFGSTAEPEAAKRARTARALGALDGAGARGVGVPYLAAVVDAIVEAYADDGDMAEALGALDPQGAALDAPDALGAFVRSKIAQGLHGTALAGAIRSRQDGLKLLAKGLPPDPSPPATPPAGTTAPDSPPMGAGADYRSIIRGHAGSFPGTPEEREAKAGKAIEAMDEAAARGVPPEVLGSVAEAAREGGADENDIAMMAGTIDPEKARDDDPRGLGELVRAKLREGLRGRSLAEAIHAEQERRWEEKHGRERPGHGPPEHVGPGPDPGPGWGPPDDKGHGKGHGKGKGH